jgi:hypothetical protein
VGEFEVAIRVNTWLTEHADVAAIWPGNVVAKLVNEILADGVISPRLKDFSKLGITTEMKVELSPNHEPFMIFHRANVFHSA